MTRFDIRSGVLESRQGAGACMRSRMSPSRCMPARRSRLSANPVAANRRPAARSCGSSSRAAGRVLFEGQDVRALDREGLRADAPAHADDLPGPIRKPQSAEDALAPRSPNRSSCTDLLKRADARDRVADLLRKVGLTPDMASRFPHEFSGGQRQRLCIARALALAPKLIVADEAVSALDVSIKAQVINLMMDLQAEMGLAYLFISHDIAVVERISHRVAVMYLGEIVEIGPRAAIIENPQHPYTKRLIAAVPVPDAGRRALRRGLSTTEIPSPVHEPTTCRRRASTARSVPGTSCRRSTRSETIDGERINRSGD